MNKINVSIISASGIYMQAYLDLVEANPDFRVIGMPADLSGPPTWLVVANTEVVIVDESVIKREGFASLQLLLDGYPDVKCLVLMENYNENNMMSAIMGGVRGIMRRDESHQLLPKAIRDLHIGEVWMPRDLLKPLRNALQSGPDGHLKDFNPAELGRWLKMH